MKKGSVILWCISMAAIALLCPYILLAKTEIEFSEPIIVFSAPKGSAPGQFGYTWGPPPCYPSDFAIDQKGNIWISDAWNRRVQKFSKDGHFLFSWEEPLGWGGGANLELDANDNVYVMNDEGESVKITVLNNDGDVLKSFRYSTLPIARGTAKTLRVNADGDVYVFGGRAVLLGSKGEIIQELGRRQIWTSPFRKTVLMSGTPQERHLNRYRYGRYERQGNKCVETADIVIETQRFEAIDPAGNVFIFSYADPISEHLKMDVYDKQGNFLATTIPDCPKTRASNPEHADEFVTDINGNLYQMQIINPELNPNSKDYLRIWKWPRLKK